ncbi:MAG TPA: AAA family ATPase, partial [Longimicrobiales bacterium]|nr:AAA family ATPase [Longimicrobiales bacterium]
VHILGEQPPVAELSPTEAQNRFHLVLIEFIRVVADRQHPLVLFLDDLQWSDVPTLALLRRLATARGLGYLCLVGAYRSNEVDVTHPLSVALDQVARSRELQIVALEPLSEKAVGELIADTLSIDVDPAAPLSDVVHAISGGNPFFIRELLGNLHERGAIFFDASTHGWSWDLDAVHSAGLGDGVVDLVVDQLRTLAEEDQHVLRLAACIGNRFDLTTLAVISEQSPEEVAQGLSESLRRNLVAPLTDDYRFVGFEEAGTGAAAPVYRFTHDRVQEAAYALIGEELRRSVHLSVGRLMLAHGSPEEIQDRLVDIVSHLNQGRALVDTPEERREIALLNLQAGEIAQASAAYESALGFLEVCRDMLPPDPWSSAYDLTLGLARQLQRCAYLNGDQTRADEWGDQILENARTTLERARALSTRTRQYATIGRMADSVDSALAGLRMLGIEIAENPDDEDIEAEIALVSENLGDRSVASLVDAPEVENAEAREALRLLMEVFAAAFLSGTGKLFPYLVLKGVNLALVNGSGPQSAFAYAAYGMILCGYMGRPALAAEYGQLGVEMNEKYDDLKLRARIIYVYAMFVHHWSHHWASMTPWFRRGIEAGYQSGDLLYLAYSAQDCIIWDPTLDLETASEEHRKYLRIVEDCDYRDSYDSGTLFLQMQLNFLGRTDGLYSMNTEDYDERTAVEGMRARGFMTGIANYQIYKAEIHALYGDWDGAMEFVRLQDDLMDSSMSLPQSVRFYMVAFLARARLWGATPEEDRPAVRARLERDLALIGGWAEHCRENFEHLRLTMLAELARLDGRLGAALEHYEAAVRTARESGFQRDEAVAAELAALCLQSAGLEHAAEGYVRQAYSAFDRWGARRKLARMEERWPWLTDAVEGGGADGGSDGDGADGPVTATALDLESVMKASRAIAGELVEQRLWATTLRILMENAGAERAWFVVRRDGGLHVVAEAEAGSG